MSPAPAIPGNRRAGADADTDSDCEGQFMMVTLHNKPIIVALFLIRSRLLYAENTTKVERVRKAGTPVTIVLHAQIQLSLKTMSKRWSPPSTDFPH